MSYFTVLPTCEKTIKDMLKSCEAASSAHTYSIGAGVAQLRIEFIGQGSVIVVFTGMAAGYMSSSLGSFY